MFSTHRETLKRSASAVTCTLDGQTKWIAGHSPGHAQLGHWHLARLHQLTTFLSSYNCFSYTQLSNRKHTVSSRGDWITNSLFTWYCLWWYCSWMSDWHHPICYCSNNQQIDSYAGHQLCDSSDSHLNISRSQSYILSLTIFYQQSQHLKSREKYFFCPSL